MMNRAIIHGLISGVLAGVACIGWWKFYEYASYVDFSPVVGYVQLMSIPVVALLFASVVYAWMVTKFKQRGEWIFHFLMTGLTLASLLGPFKAHFPDDTDEMILTFMYGLFLPMHFFPAMAWYTLKPLLNHSNK